MAAQVPKSSKRARPYAQVFCKSLLATVSLTKASPDARRREILLNGRWCEVMLKALNISGTAISSHFYNPSETLPYINEVKVTQSVQLFVTPWTIQSMEFSRPEFWSG